MSKADKRFSGKIKAMNRAKYIYRLNFAPAETYEEFKDLIIKMLSVTRKPNKCACCCNPRRWFRAKTRKEKLNILNFKEQITDIKEY